MAIEITLYKITEDPRKVGKTLPNTVGTYLTFSTSWLKDMFRVLSPELTLASTDNLADYNYMKVGAPVNRVYFIYPEILRTGLWRLNAREDVLTQFATQIKAQSGILARSSTPGKYNTYLSDSFFEQLAYRRVQTLLFSETPFSTSGNGYYLTTTSGGGGA